jgi:predicted membrane protein
MEYVIIGIFAVIFIFIFALYFINSKKINKAKKAEEAKKDGGTGEDKKVEVKSTVIQGSALENAIAEQEDANDTSNNVDATEPAKVEQKRVDNSRLKLDREEFVSEIRKSTDIGETKRVRLSSETNKIGKEGPDIVITESDEAEKKSENSSKTFADEMKSLSPEMKALLLNDILNRKY